MSKISSRFEDCRPEARIPLSELNTNNEHQIPEEIVRQMTEGNPTAGIVLARWLPYSLWLVTHKWIDEGHCSKNWWDKFTQDAKEYAPNLFQ